MGKPLKAVPQILVDDPRVADALSSIKYILDVREGRTRSDKGAMWVTFDDLTSALGKFSPQASSAEQSPVLSEYEAFEDIDAGLLVSIFDDSGTPRIKKACAMISDTTPFAPAHGYISEAVTTGGKVTVYHGGINTEYPGMGDIVDGTMLYLAETPGVCSAEKQDSYQFVGFRVADGILFIPGDASAGIKALIKEALVESLSATVETGSIADILTGIKSCACKSACSDTMIAEPDVCTATIAVIADESGLCLQTTAEYFETIDASLTFLAKTGTATGVGFDVEWNLSSEDPVCSDVSYGTGTLQPPQP